MLIIFQYFGIVLGGWIISCIYIFIGILFACANESKWLDKKYEVIINLFYVLLWPIVILFFPIWLIVRFISVSIEMQQLRKRIEND